MQLMNKSKEKVRTMLLDYAEKIYQRENRFVSKREIRKTFHIELYNYFKNMFDLYKHLRIDVPLCFCPREYAEKKIIDFVKERSEKGLYPIKKEIENELKIHIYTYFNNILELYKRADVDFSLYCERRESIEHPTYTPEQINIKRRLIVKMLQKSVKLGRYPSSTDIQRKLNLKFDLYFPNIKTAYKLAKIKYQRPCPIILGKNKEIVLTKVVVSLLEKMNYKIQRISIYDKKNPNKFEDIKITDRNNVTCLIELKAYRKEQPIAKREVFQLLQYMRSQKVGKGIIITTSNNILSRFDNIIIIDGKKLRSLLKQNNLEQYIKKINWIQEAKVNMRERIEKRMQKRKEISNYILNFNGIPTVEQIQENLCSDMRSYFERPLGRLIKRIKAANTGSIPVCKDRQLKLQCT